MKILVRDKLFIITKFKFTISCNNQVGDNMKATIKDVARECGVSIASVSMALSDKPNRISDGTRARIREVAQRLNYIPNRAAASLVTQKTRMIGFLTDDLRNSFIATNYMVIRQALQEKGYFLVTSTVTDEETNMKEAVHNLLACGIEGLIYTKSDVINRECVDEEVKEMIRRAGIPVVSCDNISMETLGTGVRCNYKKGGYIATRFLLDLGYEKVACISGTEYLKVTRDRLEGYRQALEEKGLKLEEQFVCKGDYTMKSGEEAVPYLMGKGVKAVFAFNDEMAFGVYKGAHKYGIRIPEDLSVVGFDNVPFVDVMEVPLTSVGFDAMEVGQEIAKRMMELVCSDDNENVEIQMKEYIPDLFVRASTCSCAVKDTR